MTLNIDMNQKITKQQCFWADLIVAAKDLDCTPNEVISDLKNILNEKITNKKFKGGLL